MSGHDEITSEMLRTAQFISFPNRKMPWICFVMRTFASIIKTKNLICLFPFCNVMWHNFLENSTVFFYILKNCIRIMAGAKREVSCKELFKKFNILPLSINYLISILFLFCRQKEKLQKSLNIHSIHIRQIWSSWAMYCL